MVKQFGHLPDLRAETDVGLSGNSLKSTEGRPQLVAEAGELREFLGVPGLELCSCSDLRFGDLGPGLE